MGKKAKTGKARKDKFYKLAKETGFRARSAFKLLQLNRKFEFLQKSRVCIDLCAAPGSWLQVAAQHMPVSSVIVGVDLVSIKPIPNCVTLIEDITTEKCRVALRKELQTWKADCVMNDGAPNVGKNWLFDAYAQAELTLYALKLATDFLRKGGWFITKVFRSKDYHALMWVFNQLFKKVHATKPQASRNESAEIFVVCKGFLAPDKLDPKFLDPRHVFKDVKEEGQVLNLMRPEKLKKKAEGYADGDYTLHHVVTDVEFITAENHLDMLARCSEIRIENEAIVSHEFTTNELKECCKDIKLLARKELRAIITWRKKMLPIVKQHLKEMDGSAGQEDGDDGTMHVDDDEAKKTDDESDEDDEEKVKEKLAELQEEENKEAKRKQRRVARDKRKLRDKMALNMIIPGDTITQTDDIDLFNLQKIKSKQQLKNVEADEMARHVDSESDEDMLDLPKHLNYSRGDKDMDDWSDDDNVTDEKKPDSPVKNEDSEESDELEFEMESGEEAESGQDDLPEADENPLIVNMEKRREKIQRKTDMWFKKDVFEGLEDEIDEDLEIEKMTEDYTRRGGLVKEKKKKGSKRKADEIDSGVGDNSGNDDSDDDDITLSKSKATQRQKLSENIKSKKKQTEIVKKTDTKISKTESDLPDIKSEWDVDLDISDSDSNSSESESDSETYKAMDAENLTSTKQLRRERKKEALNKVTKDGFEIVSTETVSKKIRKLDPVGLAIGEEMVKSAKRRREIIDESFNRYTFNDDRLPDWFISDEKKHTKRQLPVTKEQVNTYKEKLKLIDAAPIKKVAEARARKKKKLGRRLEKARKKAEVISDTVDVGDREKVKQMKEVYKKAGLLKAKKENVTYVVAKRGAGKRVSRPAGVKGRFKVVDPRMKKDNRKQKLTAKSSKKGKGKKSASNNKGGRGKK